MAIRGSTKPRLPDGDLPLDDATLQQLLGGLGDDMVLVGGQALAFWMDRFGIAAEGMAVTSDADALGARPRAEALARQLGGQLLVPDPRRLTALVAQVRLGHGARQRNIDVLHQLYTISGRRKSAEFTAQVRRRSGSRAA
jgi:hypothetical protein